MGIPRSVELPAGFVLPEFRFATLYDDNALDIAFVLKCARALDSAFGTEIQESVPRFREVYETRGNSIFRKIDDSYEIYISVNNY